MKNGRKNEPSQRALEEVADLLEQVQNALTPREQGAIRYSIDGGGALLSEAEARRWLLDSVDGGFPRIGFALTETPEGRVVDLAAYEDPSSQYIE